MAEIDQTPLNDQALEESTEEAIEEESTEKRNPSRFRRKCPTCFTLRTDDWWIWELVGILVSAAAFIGLGALLLRLNNRPQPDWASRVLSVNVSISPNSLVAFLLTLARLCLLIPLARSLSQLKWVWFAEKPRALSDLQVFDDGSRGVMGSFALIWRLRFRHFAVIGAIATILTLALEPFVQNTLNYYSKGVPDLAIPAQLPRAVNYTSDCAYCLGLDVGMKSAIIAGYTAAPGFNVPSYFCASGNCTWTGTPTLGICSRCTDVSDRLEKSCDQHQEVIIPDEYQECTFTLPNGFALNTIVDTTGVALAQVTALSTSGKEFAPIIYGQYKHPLSLMWSIFPDAANTSYYTEPIASVTKMYATECALVPCVQVYDSTLDSSTDYMSKGVTASFHDIVRAEDDSYHYNDIPYSQTGPSPPALGGAWFNSTPELFSNSTYHMGEETIDPLRYFMYQTVSGYMTTAGDNANGAPSFFTNTNDSADSFFLQSVFTIDPIDSCDHRLHNPGPNGTLPDSLRFTCAIENIARAMTVQIRNGALEATGKELGPRSSSRDGEKDDFAQSLFIDSSGTTIVSKTHISVTWGWLAIPAALWILALVTFLGTVLKTRKTGVRTWRTSVLAPLFIGVEHDHEEEAERQDHPMTSDGLMEKAQGLRARLVTTERETSFVAV